MKPHTQSIRRISALFSLMAVIALTFNARAQSTWMNCHEGTIETRYQQGDVHIYAMKIQGYSQGDLKTNPLANSKYICEGIFNTGRGSNTGSIYCQFTTPGGDLVFSEITADGEPKSKFKLIGGTGKWAKATGEGRVALTFTNKKVEDGPFKACVRGEGTLRLK